MRMVAVQFHFEPEGWWADSLDLPGWTCAGSTLAEVRALASEGAREFAGASVVVHEFLPQQRPTTGTDAVAITWLKFPTRIAA